MTAITWGATIKLTPDYARQIKERGLIAGKTLCRLGVKNSATSNRISFIEGQRWDTLPLTNAYSIEFPVGDPAYSAIMAR